jgi:hypothetical protein
MVGLIVQPLSLQVAPTIAASGSLFYMNNGLFHRNNRLFYMNNGHMNDTVQCESLEGLDEEVDVALLLPILIGPRSYYAYLLAFANHRKPS